MQSFKTQVHVTFNYGGFIIWFYKTFDLPVAPFPGLMLTDTDGEHEITITLTDNDYQSTLINLDVNKSEFDVTVNHYWRRPVDPSEIDDVLERYAGRQWQRVDSTDTENLKQIMASK